MNEKSNAAGYDLYRKDGEMLDAAQYPHLRESVKWIRASMPFFTLARGSVGAHQRLLEDGNALVHCGIDRVRFSNAQEIKSIEEQLEGWRKRYDRILDSGGDNVGGERITLAPRDILLTNLIFDRPLNRTAYQNVLSTQAYPDMAEFGNMDMSAHEIHTALYVSLFDILTTKAPEVSENIIRSVPLMIDVIVPDAQMNAAVKTELQKDMIPVDESRWSYWFKRLRGVDQ